ncbi:MAG TPA: putative metal-dependent hydrolase [Gemmatimonadaceae bacterium]|nr:putative metal-dependent hydrolase [Gemmatimonadaceae bacterium]
MSPDPRFPIGKFTYDGDNSPAARAARIADVEALPALFRDAVRRMSDAQLDTPYRDGGWTARQVVHHVPDSHMNALIRFKLALTEDTPTIKPYDEAAWATLPDATRTPVDVSLALLDALHRRWVVVLRAMSPSDFERSFMHPEHKRTMTLDQSLALYAWHGRHHLGHVKQVRAR